MMFLAGGEVKNVFGKEGRGSVDKWPVIWQEKTGLGDNSR